MYQTSTCSNGITHQTIHNLWLYAAVVLLMMGANSPETCRANGERNKQYSVHLVGPELYTCITKMYGTMNLK
jgi:hypothetical protein